MKTITRLLATVSVLAIVSACGSGAGDDSGAESSNGAGDQAGSDTAAQSDVVSVALSQSGGLKPVDVNRVFSADTAPPEGYDAADIQKVLDAAEAYTASGTSPNPMPLDTCCDRYEYRITITYSDGSTATIQTLDGLRQPPAVRALLSAVS